MTAFVFTGFIMRLEFGMVLRNHLRSLNIADYCHSHDGLTVPVSSLLKRTGLLLRWFQTVGSSQREDWATEMQSRWVRFNHLLLWGLDHSSGELCGLRVVHELVVLWKLADACQGPSSHVLNSLLLLQSVIDVNISFIQ